MYSGLIICIQTSQSQTSYTACVYVEVFFIIFFFFKFNSLSFIIRFLQCVKFTHSLMMTISRFHICFKVLISRKRMFRIEKIVFISRHHHRHWQTTATIDKQNTEKYAKFFFCCCCEKWKLFFCVFFCSFSADLFDLFLFLTQFVFGIKCVLPTISLAACRAHWFYSIDCMCSFFCFSLCTLIWFGSIFLLLVFFCFWVGVWALMGAHSTNRYTNGGQVFWHETAYYTFI